MRGVQGRIEQQLDRQMTQEVGSEPRLVRPESFAEEEGEVATHSLERFVLVEAEIVRKVALDASNEPFDGGVGFVRWSGSGRRETVALKTHFS